MIITAKIETPAGPMSAASVDEGICLLAFEGGITAEKEPEYLARHFKTSILKGENEHISMLREQLGEYFRGNRKEFSVVLVTPGTSFQQAVWNELLSIRYGTTRTYFEQSVALGNPKSIRAVAHANGMNRIAILIPCHRIIGTDGSLTGYAGGLWRKKWLLDHERQHSGSEYDQSLFESGANMNNK